MAASGGLLAAMGACSAPPGVPTSFVDVPASCAPEANVAGCVGASRGYSCSGSDGPGANNPAIECSAGTASAGKTLYCCIDAGDDPFCTSDSNVPGCGGSSLGLSCTGPQMERPGQESGSLVCSQGVPGTKGDTLYCCANFPLSPTTCEPDFTVQCGASTLGFFCLGSDTPESINPTLTCTSGTAGTSGGTVYCCETGSTPLATCRADSAVTCAAPTTGVTCVGGATPLATMFCGSGTAKGASTSYCCGSSLTSDAVCAPDGTADCGSGEAGYTCTGGAQPDTTLLCNGPGQATNGTASFCCSPRDAPSDECGLDPTVTGCPAGASGWSCITGVSETPDEGALLTCTAAPTSPSGRTGYCCEAIP
jgi:hypothetical protein